MNIEQCDSTNDSGCNCALPAGHEGTHLCDEVPGEFHEWSYTDLACKNVSDL